MREIKFRAWDKINERMGDVLQYLPYAGKNGTVKIQHEGGQSYITDEFDLMQFTGLLDKNGNEIYEGDRVKVTIYDQIKYEYIDRISEVVYDHDGFCLNPISSNKYQGALYAFGRAKENQLEKEEIIGNIYENPELLTK